MTSHINLNYTFDVVYWGTKRNTLIRHHVFCAPLIRALICRSWTSTANFCVAPHAVLTISTIKKQLIRDNTNCSSIRQAFSDGVTCLLVCLIHVAFCQIWAKADTEKPGRCPIIFRMSPLVLLHAQCLALIPRPQFKVSLNDIVRRGIELTTPGLTVKSVTPRPRSACTSHLSLSLSLFLSLPLSISLSLSLCLQNAGLWRDKKNRRWLDAAHCAHMNIVEVHVFASDVTYILR